MIIQKCPQFSQKLSASNASMRATFSVFARVGVGGLVVITRFKAKSQFKLDFTGTELELSLAIILDIEMLIFFYT